MCWHISCSLSPPLHSSHSFPAHKLLVLHKSLILHSLLSLVFFVGCRKKSCQMGSSGYIRETEQKPLPEFVLEQQIVTFQLWIACASEKGTTNHWVF